MAEIMYDGRRIPIPEGTYTGLELQENVGAEKDAIPVIHREGKDIPVAPNEQAILETGDRISFNTPMEAA